MSFSIKDAFTMDPAYDVGTYEAPSWTVDDNFFKYDPDTTGGIDWSTIYGNQDVLSGYGGDFDSNLFKKGLKFLTDYSEGSGTDERSQYFDQQKAASGLPTDKSRGSWYEQISPSVGVYGGGGYGNILPAIQGAQSLAGMQGMPSMGVKDVVGAGMRMAGQTGNAKVKVENLEVLKIMSDKNIIVVKGSVPGARNSYITIEK